MKHYKSPETEPDLNIYVEVALQISGEWKTNFQ